LDGGVDLDTEGAEPLVAGVAGRCGEVRVYVWPALDSDWDDDADDLRGRPGLRRARRRRGESGSPVLLAFHGWTEGGGVFGPLAEALGRRWTVVAPDAPAHGGTTWRPSSAYRLDDQIDVGLAVLDALPRLRDQHSPVVTLGHGIGAIPAAGITAAPPRAVRHVVLEDPVRATTARTARWQTGRRRRLQALQALDLDERPALVRAEHPDWPNDELGPWARTKDEVDIAHLRVPADWGEPLVPRLADVRCPVTLVRGAPVRGGLVSAVSARRVAAVCRAGCEIVALDAGHDVRREARTPFVATLASVLARYEP
jgi:pimeloyl-ACP methyl ester carboxylesterase